MRPLLRLLLVLSALFLGSEKVAAIEIGDAFDNLGHAANRLAHRAYPEQFIQGLNPYAHLTTRQKLGLYFRTLVRPPVSPGVSFDGGFDSYSSFDRYPSFSDRGMRYAGGWNFERGSRDQFYGRCNPYPGYRGTSWSECDWQRCLHRYDHGTRTCEMLIRREYNHRFYRPEWGHRRPVYRQPDVYIINPPQEQLPSFEPLEIPKIKILRCEQDQSGDILASTCDILAEKGKGPANKRYVYRSCPVDKNNNIVGQCSPLK